ncbi:BPSL0761 family protein [Pseudomonas sp. PDNC002]|uniref:BPSL0761 family protein n=1 Tax=Pseudomonas sp. PDNC002 TaxID=2811422 RepID=UPI0031F4E404
MREVCNELSLLQPGPASRLPWLLQWSVHMTLPSERTRSIVLARELLTQLEQDPAQREDVRSLAGQILRHYPSKGEVLLQGMIEESRPRSAGLSPFLSSVLTTHSLRTNESLWVRLRRRAAQALLAY